MTDTSTAAAIFSPVLGVDDARWYLLQLSAMMGDTRFMELQAPLDEAMLNFNEASGMMLGSMPVP